MKTLNELFADLIFANECGNEANICKLTDSDGVRSGKAGYSFGKCQFDTRNNDKALMCLAACGFTQDEIHGVVDQTIDIRPLNAKLAAHADIIEKYDEAQLSGVLNAAVNICTANGIDTDGCGGILAMADNINQYGSIGTQFIAFLKALNRPVVAADTLQFKLLRTKYGKEHPKDCHRRYDNLVKLLA